MEKLAKWPMEREAVRVEAAAVVEKRAILER